MTPQELANAAAAAMWEEDQASQGMGMQIVSVAPGEAVMTMVIRPHHLNGLGICHGGFIFALADSAFAFACNSYNDRVVAQSNTITYLAPGLPNHKLTAMAREVSRAGRSGVYDVSVTDQTGMQIALFRGLSRQIRGKHVPKVESEHA